MTDDDQITISTGDPDDNRQALRNAVALAQTRGQDAARRGLTQWDGPTTTIEVREPWEVLADQDCLRLVEWLARCGRKAGMKIQIDMEQVASRDAFHGSPVLLTEEREGRL